MKNKQTQTISFLALKPSFDTRNLIKEIVASSSDPIVHKQTWGWWPRLVKEALTVYLAYLQSGEKWETHGAKSEEDRLRNLLRSGANTNINNQGMVVEAGKVKK